MIKFKYYVFNDCMDFDDFGDQQVSIYSTWIESEFKLTPDQVIDIAEEKADWRIAFGEGDEDLCDTYKIEEKDLTTGSLLVIANGYSRFSDTDID
jgi:hypothetical protein